MKKQGRGKPTEYYSQTEKEWYFIRGPFKKWERMGNRLNRKGLPVFVKF